LSSRNGGWGDQRRLVTTACPYAERDEKQYEPVGSKNGHAFFLEAANATLASDDAFFEWSTAIEDFTGDDVHDR
jgi:hypothetical protein